MNKNFFKFNNIDFPQVNYGFFTRLIQEQNNISLIGNSKKNLKYDIQKAKILLKIKNKKIKLANQIHSNYIAEVNKNNFYIQKKVDGLITSDKSIGIGVLTADCAPIFIFDKSKKFICCLHAGWKGVLKNIAKCTVKLILEKYNNNLNDIVVIIGPCLHKNKFEVSLDFKDKFSKVDENYQNFFTKKTMVKEIFDMRGLINSQFKSLGLKNIYNVNKDTYINNQFFFSHRRGTHNNVLETGRMINIICFQ